MSAELVSTRPPQQEVASGSRASTDPAILPELAHARGNIPLFCILNYTSASGKGT